MSQQKPGQDLLRRIHLFAGFEPEQLATMCAATQLRELSEGERLFDFAQPAIHFFYLQDGLIKLFRDSQDGNEKVIEIVHAGETFAEAVMFMPGVSGYPVSAEAIAASRVWAFDSSTMVSLLSASVSSCFRLMASLSVRLRQQIDEIERLTLHNATYRVVGYLLRQVPEAAGPRREVHLSVPKNVLASRLGIAPETFSRILANLSKQGLLRVQRNDIVIRDQSSLYAILDQEAGALARVGYREHRR